MTRCWLLLLAGLALATSLLAPLKGGVNRIAFRPHLAVNSDDVLTVLNSSFAELVSNSKDKFQSGAYSNNAKTQMGNWIAPSYLARVFRLLNETTVDQEAIKSIYKMDTMRLLKVELLHSWPEYTLSLFHIPAYGSLPARKHREGTVLIYKVLYGDGKLSSLMEDGRQIASEALSGPGKNPELRGNSGVPYLPGSLFSRIGGPRRIAAWSRPDANALDAPGTGQPLGFLELAFFPPDTDSSTPQELLCDTESEVASAGHVTDDQRRSILMLWTTKLAARESAATAAAEKAAKAMPAPAKKEKFGKVLAALRQSVGGLDVALEGIVRRVLKSRSLAPSTLSALGLSHVRGLLLYGPPGTGKTLIARELAKVLNARPPKIVNGPELLDKYVGEAERNIRQLFAEADEEWDRLGLKSELHVIILDEVDSIAKRRGSSLVGSDGNGVRESVTNQLLAKIDGIKERNNVLVIGLTNRRDLLDPALLRPGRLEAQIEISGPSRQGRRDIMAILLRGLVKSAVLSETEAADVSERVAARTAGFTGAELAGVLRSAASFALSRLDDEHDDEGEAEGKGDGGDELAKIAFTLDDFQRGIDEVCSTKWKGMGKARQRLALLREWLSQRHKV